MVAVDTSLLEDDVELDPSNAYCSGGCKRCLRVNAPRYSGAGRSRRPPAYSEAVDVHGRRLYFCRSCTEKLYSGG